MGCSIPQLGDLKRSMGIEPMITPTIFHVGDDGAVVVAVLTAVLVVVPTTTTITHHRCY